MRKVQYNASLAVKVSEAQRAAVEHLALTKDLSLGEATRELLSKGIEVIGIKV
jgi:hypothetical protein